MRKSLDKSAALDSGIVPDRTSLTSHGGFGCTMEENVSKISGRVVGLRKLNKNLAFIELNNGAELLDCVYENLGELPSKGDYLVVEGQWRKKQHRKELEFGINKVVHAVKLGKVSNDFAELMLPARTEALTIRTAVNRALQTFFIDRKFAPVQSPALVGNWVEGQTRAFDVQYHGNETAYLSISTILHHQMIQALGYDKIYEVTKGFRRENGSSKKKLSEYTNVVAGIIDGKSSDLITLFSDLLTSVHREIRQIDPKHNVFPEQISFDTIKFVDLVKESGLKELTGHQLPNEVRSFMNENFSNFVWITGFPEHTRPFYVKSEAGECRDCQLWYKGKNYIAAGGEIETNRVTVAQKILNEGKDVKKFEFHLAALEVGLPPLANIDMGIERLLGTWAKNSRPADFTFFPRYSGHLSP